uniref:Uncharacterized protein n=1 Tax=Rhizophora mucronata TaxID=61149 RepID=A0A2P2QS52_RHIMU
MIVNRLHDSTGLNSAIWCCLCQQNTWENLAFACIEAYYKPTNNLNL